MKIIEYTGMVSLIDEFTEVIPEQILLNLFREKVKIVSGK